MTTPTTTEPAFLSAIPGRAGVTAQDLAGRLEARLANVVVELEGLRTEIAALAAFAWTPTNGSNVAPKLLTVRQAATMLGVGQSTVHHLIRTGRLASRKLAGSRRVAVVDVDAFIASLPDQRKERDVVARRARGEGSMYQTPDGRWHASLNLGPRLDGRRRRRHVEGRTQTEVKKKLDRLKSQRDAGVDIAASHLPTVGEWTDTWIAIVERTRRPSTAKTYRTHLKYLQPLRRIRLDQLTSEHIENVYVGLTRRGVRPISVQGVHRTYR
jgi:excisionase family DNA binding protein